MPEFKSLWGDHALAEGETIEFKLGPLRIWVHRGSKEWHIAHQSDGADEGGSSLSVTEAEPGNGRDWTRWILDKDVHAIRFLPRLPDRPVIVRPEMPMCLMPKQSVEFYIGIPLSVGILFGSRSEEAMEVPTRTLSNSWFGSVTEGELCYALKTTAKLYPEKLLPGVHRAVFPLEIKNISTEKLNFERLCVRPQFLNIFQGKTRLWTSKGRVSYRGEENWSRIVYASGSPEIDGAAQMVGTARETLRRGALLKTFDSIKQKVEIL